MEKAHVTDYLTDTWPEIPDCLMKILFLGEAEIAVR